MIGKKGADGQVAIMDEMVASSSLGMRMQHRKDSLLQRPSVWIVDSATPLAAAVLAAPMRNEWPEKWVESMPAVLSVDLNQDIRACLDRGEPFSRMKSATWELGFTSHEVS